MFLYRFWIWQYVGSAILVTSLVQRWVHSCCSFSAISSEDQVCSNAGYDRMFGLRCGWTHPKSWHHLPFRGHWPFRSRSNYSGVVIPCLMAGLCLSILNLSPTQTPAFIPMLIKLSFLSACHSLHCSLSFLYHPHPPVRLMYIDKPINQYTHTKTHTPPRTPPQPHAPTFSYTQNTRSTRTLSSP